MISFDPNILVYAAYNAAGERHRRAADLSERSIRRGTCVQTLQSLGEFFSVVTRKSGIAPDAAAPSWRAGERSVNIGSHSGYGPLWATARRTGVRILISEDFEDGRMLDGARFINHFAAHNLASLEQLLPR